MTAAARPPVVVLFGGPSGEHDVSIVSGTAVAAALAGAGLTVSQVCIDLDGAWWWLPAGHRRDERPAAEYDDPGALGAEGPVSFGAALDRLRRADPPVVAFIVLHGPFGEDGTIQGALEAAGIAYAGAGVAASAVGMDKAFSKRLWRGLGLPVVDWLEVSGTRWAADPAGVLADLEAFAAAHVEPRLMVKPARLGSSVGMTLAHTPGERRPALEAAFAWGDLVVVETYLAGARDLEVSVIGPAAAPEVYGPGEIMAGHEFYDFEAKYTPGLSRTTTRAELDPATRELARRLAGEAYRAVGADGFARVDFLLAGGRLYVSEINTIPGFTPISLFPTLPAEAGLDFEAVCLRVLDLAVERAAGRASRRLRPADLPR
jgi:D-alanine-D-alanine ligase